MSDAELVAAVVAMWLAAAGLEGGTEGLQRLVDERPSATFLHFDFVHSRSVPLSVADARLALELLRRPADEVQNELTRRWDQVIDPATTSADLAFWFGLPAPQFVDTPFFAEPCP